MAKNLWVAGSNKMFDPPRESYKFGSQLLSNHATVDYPCQPGSMQPRWIEHIGPQKVVASAHWSGWQYKIGRQYHVPSCLQTHLSPLWHYGWWLHSLRKRMNPFTPQNPKPKGPDTSKIRILFQPKNEANLPTHQTFISGLSCIQPGYHRCC